MNAPSIESHVNLVARLRVSAEHEALFGNSMAELLRSAANRIELVESLVNSWRDRENKLAAEVHLLLKTVDRLTQKINDCKTISRS